MPEITSKVSSFQRKISKIKVGIASPDRIMEWSNGEVKKPETLNHRTSKPEKEGLFCEKIFGPMKDYECSCGKYKGKKYEGTVCERCGVRVEAKESRRRRMGHIELATPVSHIWYLKSSPSILSIMLSIAVKDLENIIYYGSKRVIEGVFLTLVNDNSEEEFDTYPSEIIYQTECDIYSQYIDMKVERAVRVLRSKSAPVTENSGKVSIKADVTHTDREITWISVKSADGTERRYPVFEGASILVEEGQQVEVGTPLADRIVYDDDYLTQTEYKIVEEHYPRVLEVEKDIERDTPIVIITDIDRDFAKRINKNVGDILLEDEAKAFEAVMKILNSKVKSDKENIIGTRLAEDLVLRNENVVLDQGMQITPELLDRLLNNDIKQVYAYEENPDNEILFQIAKYETFTAKYGAEAIKELLVKIDLEVLKAKLESELSKLDKRSQKALKLLKRLKLVKDFIKSNNKPEWMITTYLPVVPPDLRPLIQIDGGRFAATDLNDLYRKVINRNNRLRKLLEMEAPEIIVRNEKRILQQAVDSLIYNGRVGKAMTDRSKRPLRSLTDLLKGKKGRFRRNLLGKRVDYSGRAVITVGPDLKIHECGLPKKMALELFKPFVLSELLKDSNVASKNARKLKKTIIEKEMPQAWEILEEVIKGHPVLLNRAPTLHRISIQAFIPRLIEGNVIRLHPLVCSPFNADFDGDQMAVHVPLSSVAQAEAKFLMLSRHNIISPANGKPISMPSKDIIVGSYYLTAHDDKKFNEAKLPTGIMSMIEGLKMLPEPELNKNIIELDLNEIDEDLVYTLAQTIELEDEVLHEDDILTMSRVDLLLENDIEKVKVYMTSSKVIKNNVDEEFILPNKNVKYIFSDEYESDYVHHYYKVVDSGIYVTRNEETGDIKYFWGQPSVKLHTPIALYLNGKLVKTTVGKIIFNENVPEELRDYTAKMKKKKLRDLIFNTFRNYGIDRTAEILDYIKDIGFHYATMSGLTVSIRDVEVSEKREAIIEGKNTEVLHIEKLYEEGYLTDEERYVEIVHIWEKATEAVTEVTAEVFTKLTFNPIWIMIDSGARGNIDQLKQLAGMRGLMADPAGKIIEVPIKSNFKSGLSELEFFTSTHGSRKGSADTALRTSTAGYLTRRLVDVAQSIVVNEVDCGTEKGIEALQLIVDNSTKVEELNDFLFGRALSKDVLDPETDIVIEKEYISEKKCNLGFVEVNLDKEGIWYQLAEDLHATMDIPVEKDRIVDQALLDELKEYNVEEIKVVEHRTKRFVRNTILDEDDSIFLSKYEKEIEVVKDYEVELSSFVPLAYTEAMEDIHNPADGEVIIEAGEEVTKESIQELTIHGIKKLKIKEFKAVGFVYVGDDIRVRDENGKDLMILKYQEKIEHRTAKTLKKHGIDKVLVRPSIFIRSPLTCESENGVCSKCYGMDLSNHDVVSIGESVGIIAAQSIGEPGTQLTMRTFHTGGIATASDITQGLPRAEELFEARKKTKGADGIFSKVKGTIKAIERGNERDKKNAKITFVIETDTGESEIYEADFRTKAVISVGDRVLPGDRLTTGNIKPKKVLEELGVDEVSMYLLKEIKKIYAEQGVDIHDKHFEIIIRQMLNKIEIVDGGDTDYMPGDLLSYQYAREINEGILEENSMIPANRQKILGKRLARRVIIVNDEKEVVFEAEHEVTADILNQLVEFGTKEVEVYETFEKLENENGEVNVVGETKTYLINLKETLKYERKLLRITKASLEREGWLSAASFQQTVQILTEASIEGKEDFLKGLKENVIIGQPIPAGTGLKIYSELNYEINEESRPHPTEPAEYSREAI